MPHLNLKYFPRNLNEQEKQELVNALAEVLKQHLNTADETISIEMHEVNPSDWKAQVYDPIIKPNLDSLAKKPGYEL